LPEKDLERIGDQMVTNVGEVCELVTEENYVFNASDQQKIQIQRWISNETVKPEQVRNKVLDDLVKQKQSISVSRPSARLSWGIKVPND